MPTKFEFPKVVQPVHLDEYAKEFGDTVISIWVNPSRAKLDKFHELAEMSMRLREQLHILLEIKQPDKVAIEDITKQLEDCGIATIEWLSEIWSQGNNDTRWPVDEIKELLEHCQDTDPAFYDWLVTRTWRAISEHRSGQKKR